MESSQEVQEVGIITQRRILLSVNCIILGIGLVGGPLITRLYYIHGGSRPWFQACLQTAGFPIMLFPLFLSYLSGRSVPDSKPLLMTPTLLAFALGNGHLAGTADYLYARCLGMIPVSTSSLILSTQLGFTAVFCYFLVKQRFTASSVNAVMAAGILAMHPKSDMKGESTSRYFEGFFITLAASACFALVLPLVELSYNKAKVEVTYDLVMETHTACCKLRNCDMCDKAEVYTAIINKQQFTNEMRCCSDKFTDSHLHSEK